MARIDFNMETRNTPLLGSFQRMGNFPIDVSSVFFDENALNQYITSSPSTRYDGQIVALIGQTNVRLFVIKGNTKNEILLNADLQSKIDIAVAAAKAEIEANYAAADNALSLRINSAISAIQTTLEAELANKVDKVPGKELSSNDFTNELKAKLESLSNYDDTSIRGEISQLSSDIEATYVKQQDIENLQNLPSVEEISNAIELISSLNVYTKSETYSKAEVNSLLNSKADSASVDELYLKKTDAASQYLSMTKAAEDYLVKADASTTYLSKSDAESIYLKKEDAQAGHIIKEFPISWYGFDTNFRGNAEVDPNEDNVIWPALGKNGNIVTAIYDEINVNKNAAILKCGEFKFFITETLYAETLEQTTGITVKAVMAQGLYAKDRTDDKAAILSLLAGEHPTHENIILIYIDGLTAEKLIALGLPAEQANAIAQKNGKVFLRYGNTEGDVDAKIAAAVAEAKAYSDSLDHSPYNDSSLISRVGALESADSGIIDRIETLEGAAVNHLTENDVNTLIETALENVGGSGTAVSANDTLSGNEPDLTSLTVDGVNYKIPVAQQTQYELNSVMYEYLLAQTFRKPAIKAFSVEGNGTYERGASINVTRFSHYESELDNIDGNLALWKGSTNLQSVVPADSSTNVSYQDTITTNTTFYLKGTDLMGNQMSVSASFRFETYAYSVVTSASTPPLSGATRQAVDSTFRTNGADFSYGVGDYIYIYSTKANAVLEQYAVGQWNPVDFENLGKINNFVQSNNVEYSDYYVYRTKDAFIGSGTAKYRVN